MMKMMNNTEKMNKVMMVIAVDHGYGNIKGTGFVFKSGVTMYDTEPTFQQDLLIYEGKYYQIGAEHKEFVADKMMDEDYYILTLAAVAREMNIRKVTSGKVHLAAGLPLTWVSKQKESFKSYLLKNEKVRFTFRGVEYSVEFVGADIFPQGFAAVADKLRDFKGVNMLADIGNGTMNIMYINNCRPVEKQCFTEKYGTNQCILAVRESLLKQFGTVVDDLVIEQVIRTGTADISERYLMAIRESAANYVAELFRKLREHEYNPELMRLYIVGGGSCMIENFGEYEKDRVTIIKDICATAKGYELLATRKLRKNGVIS
jgi:plasmid segregation protein ParM